MRFIFIPHLISHTRRSILYDMQELVEGDHCLFPKVAQFNVGKSLIPIGGNFRRFVIKGIIGRGGYGEIYYAYDPNQCDHIALKIESKMRRGKLAKRTILEQKILLRMQGRPHCPKMISSGSEGQFNFIALEVLSVNLSDLRKSSPGKKLSSSTTARVLQQGIGALYDLHNIGYVHRDVKPPNMCFGVRYDNKHILYLLDFGLVRRYLKEDGTLRVRRERAGFRGTFRYVSVRVHEKKEQCPADDMISLIYTSIELACGYLPWKNVTSSEQIKAQKNNIAKEGFSSLSNILSPQMIDISRSIVALIPWTSIDYSRLQYMLNGALDGLRLTDPYDWHIKKSK